MSASSGFPIRLRLANVLLDVIADHMKAKSVAFLDAGSCRRGNSYGFLRNFGHRPPILPAECDRKSSNSPRRLKCPAYVLTVSGCRDSDYYISRSTDRLNLPLKNAIVTVVVANRRENRRVGSQGNRRQRPALFQEAADEFCSHVLGIGCAAAIAAPENLVAIENTAAYLLGDSLQLRDRLLQSLDGFQVLFQSLFKHRGQIQIASPGIRNGSAIILR